MNKKTMKTLFSTGNDEWATPKWLYDMILDNGYKDINPFNCSYDALDVGWFNRTYCNPPYSKKLLSKFVDKAIDQYKKGCKVLLLIPSRTDTKYFHKLLNCNIDITFIKGRLKFNEIGSAPFPSLLIKLKPFNNDGVLVKTLDQILEEI